jgi:hypothetical protein
MQANAILLLLVLSSSIDIDVGYFTLESSR